MTQEQAAALCKTWGEDFEQLFAEVESCFARSESRTKAKAYLRGLMSDISRKNSWQLAERLSMKSPLGLQRLLNEAKWDAAEVMQMSRQLLSRVAKGDELAIRGRGG